MNVVPTQIERLPGNLLRIHWNDGIRMTYSVRRLRESCPCATCREKRSLPPVASSNVLPILSPEEARPLTIMAMRPVGNYAYSIQFSDDHDSGIFTFALLRELGEAEVDSTIRES
jgi:DUF971 family protein